MNLSKNQLYTVEISALAFGGKAVARLEIGAERATTIGSEGAADMTTNEGAAKSANFVIFIAGGVPGDIAEIQLTKIKKQYAEGKIVRIVKESGLRTKPRCQHFGVCGGCQWQFLPYEEQVRFKEKEVFEALTHLGGIENPPLLSIRESPSPWFYRNKMEYSF